MSFKRFKTEKMLLVSIGVLTLFLFASAFSKELGTNVSMAEEESGASSPSSNEASSNEVSEDSGSDSEDNTSEDSDNKEESEPSVSSTTSARRVQTAGSTEVSEKSSSEASQQSAEEASEASEPSEESQEVSEESIKYVEGYGDIVSKEGNVMLVKKDEKLFFLIPVEVESQVTLDEQGSVVDAKKSFLNWLLSMFSF